MPSGLVTLTPLNDRSSCIITLRLFSSVSRSVSTTLCSPVSAPSAAAWRTTEVHEVVCAWTLVMISTICFGAMTQPMRNPVIPYSLEMPLMTMTCVDSMSFVVNLYAAMGVLPSKTSLW